MLDLAVVPPKSHWFDMLNAPEGFNADAEDLWQVDTAGYPYHINEGLHDMIADIRADHPKKLQLLGRVDS
ncbi:hypothetical protein M885DRAFT_562477 [Pelagophyceae sp. CCMP2097]|nr:hypothetical protein M885DRAFT_562477 [Pelagophyceae sp. CCMP2097]